MKNNEFVIRFSNVNGSGSASANQTFAKGLYRCGLAVSAKNIFPSNIQGAPTSYEIRASQLGYTGRTEDVDILVALNPQTFPTDLSLLPEGGLFIYDSTITRDFMRPNISILGVPFTKICLDEFGDIKQRFMFKNLVVNGVLSELIGIDPEIFLNLVAEQFSKKPKLIEPNHKAYQLGYEWSKSNLTGEARPRLNFRYNELTESEKDSQKIMVSGNEAAGLGCVFGGASVAAWYPITPSTSVAEAFTTFCERFRKSEGGQKAAIVQAEDELSAAGVAIGAGWNGARAFTATSGPGISLMSEFIGLAYFAEVPVVFINIQRGGPSTGMPTRTQQSDILSTAYASHGDTIHPMLFPSDPKECFSMAVHSFDMADRLQTPVFLMSDLDLGMNEWYSDEFEFDYSRVWDRGKIITAEQLDEWKDWGRYKDMDGDGVCYRSLPGTHPEKGAYLSRGTSHNEMGGYTEDGKIHAEVLHRIHKKWELAREMAPSPIIEGSSSSVGVIYFGSTAPPMQEAQDILASEGFNLDLMRLRGFPFNKEVDDFLRDHETLIVVEQNRDGQMRKLLSVEADVAMSDFNSVLCFDGMPPTAKYIVRSIKDIIGTSTETARRSTA